MQTTPLIAAASSAHPDAVKKLLEAGAVHSLVDDGNCSALRHACVAYCGAVGPRVEEGFRARCLATIQELVDHIVKREHSLDACNPDGENAMSASASIHGSLDVVRVLLKAGADPNGRTVAGMTPLMHAADADDWRVCGQLLRKGADPFLRNARGKTACELAYANGKRNFARLLRRLC